jgi:hypothetical protein
MTEKTKLLFLKVKAKFTEQIKSPHVQLALAVGTSILAMAIASKRLLPEPIGYLSLAIPPFLGTIYETLYSKHPDSKLCTPWYWILAIVLATALVIALHMV